MRTTFLVSLLLAIVVLSMPSATAAQIGVSITIAPPVLPVYEQPICPAPNNIWTPGYWAYGPEGYFWVPGTWIEAPQVGFLWTPGYWGWGGGVYLWHGGYWGPHIGFYGGVNYGFGYGGVGYAGGEWRPSWSTTRPTSALTAAPAEFRRGRMRRKRLRRGIIISRQLPSRRSTNIWPARITSYWRP